MSPKFSIVLPTIGRLDLIRRSLYSALRQQDQFDNYEIVVLDNCSEDGTWDYLQSIENSRLKVFRNSHRLPTGQNWNKAITLSNGAFVYMLQDDNVILPDMLATISNSLTRHKDVDLVCFAAQFMHEDERDQRSAWRPEREELLPAPQALMRFAREWTTSASHMVFSRTAFDHYGGFNETPRPLILSDPETILRWMIYCDTLIIPDSLAMHRNWSGTVTATIQSSPETSLEWFTAQTHFIEHLLRLTNESGRLNSDQLEDLRLALVQTFLIDLAKRPRNSAR